MKKIDEWLNKLLGIGKGEDVERPVGNKDSVDRIRSMESNKEYRLLYSQNLFQCYAV